MHELDDIAAAIIDSAIKIHTESPRLRVNQSPRNRERTETSTEHVAPDSRRD
jgi:hypothetical protein